MVRLALLRASWWDACVAAGVAFAVGGGLVYSLPSVVLQSAARNAGALGFAIYLAMLANKT